MMIMKKIFYLALVAIVMVACGQSQEQKAEYLIKESLKKSLYKPETYKPVETKVDSAFAPCHDRRNGGQDRKCHRGPCAGIYAAPV